MAEVKSKTEYTAVTMSDGRVVQFAGKKKMIKETLVDESKVETDGSVLQISAGAIKIRLDFRNGTTVSYDMGLSLLARFAGHGAEQKLGDNLAAPADKPLSEEDMVVETEALIAELDAGKWGKGRAEGGGGVSGASIVVQAIMEVTGKDLAFVKAFLQKKLDADAALTRRALYDAFRAPGSPTAVVIRRLEDEKAAKNSKVDTNALLGEAMQ